MKDFESGIDNLIERMAEIDPSILDKINQLKNNSKKYADAMHFRNCFENGRYSGPVCIVDENEIEILNGKFHADNYKKKFEAIGVIYISTILSDENIGNNHIIATMTEEEWQIVQKKIEENTGKAPENSVITLQELNANNAIRMIVSSKVAMAGDDTFDGFDGKFAKHVNDRMMEYDWSELEDLVDPLYKHAETIIKLHAGSNDNMFAMLMNRLEHMIGHAVEVYFDNVKICFNHEYLSKRFVSDHLIMLEGKIHHETNLESAVRMITERCRNMFEDSTIRILIKDDNEIIVPDPKSGERGRILGEIENSIASEKSVSVPENKLEDLIKILS